MTSQEAGFHGFDDNVLAAGGEDPGLPADVTARGFHDVSQGLVVNFEPDGSDSEVVARLRLSPEITVDVPVKSIRSAKRGEGGEIIIQSSKKLKTIKQNGDGSKTVEVVGGAIAVGAAVIAGVVFIKSKKQSYKRQAE